MEQKTGYRRREAFQNAASLRAARGQPCAAAFAFRSPVCGFPDAVSARAGAGMS